MAHVFLRTCTHSSPPGQWFAFLCVSLWFWDPLFLLSRSSGHSSSCQPVLSHRVFSIAGRTTNAVLRPWGRGETPPSLSSTSSYWQTRQSSLLLYNFRIRSSELCRDKPAHEGSFEYLSFVPSIILPASHNPNSPKDDWIVIVAVTLNVSLCLAPGWIIDG